MICRIIPPSLWDYWGISSTRISDFAIFDHHVLVTYYPNERFMLYVRPISDQWRLLSCNKFLGALSTAVIDYYWTPEEFMRIVYQGPTSTNEKLCKEIRRLMAYVDKEQTVQTTHGVLKENVCRQILGVLGTVTEREAKDLMKKPPFNRPRKLSLIKDYAVNQKEVLKELTELVKPHK